MKKQNAASAAAPAPAPEETATIAENATDTGAPSSEAAAEQTEEHALVAGDRVRVYQDAERIKFYTGSIVTLHDGGHAADVKLNELDGAVSTVRVEMLEYDDRA